MLGHERCLLGLVLLGHFLGVAARGLRVLEFFVLDRKEFCAEAFDLLLRRGTHIGRRDDRAEPPRGRDGLQAGDADAHDEHLCRRNRAGGSHHHRQRAAIFLGGIDHRTIAGEVRLARQHVHRLRAGNARHQFHGDRGNPGVRHLLERGLVAVRIHDGDDERAFLVVGEFGRRRPTHFENDVGILGDGVGDLRARRFEFAVGDPGRNAGATRNRDIGAERFQLLDSFRGSRDPGFTGIGFTRYGNSHSRLPARP